MRRYILCTTAALLLGGGAASAGVSFDVALGMDINEDTRIFLNVTNQTWRPAVATTVIQGCADPEDDFPVIAFLAYHSHRSPSFILNLRREGYTWADIFFQINVSPSVVFVGIDRDPGPPYGKAWGYWKKHYRPGARLRYRIGDRDIVGLVKVQTAARHFSASPFAVIEAQRSGRRPEVFAADRWKKKHGRETWTHGPGKGKGQGRKSGGDEKGSGHGHGSGGGHGKGHGNGKGGDGD